jgi:hypothetical protein
MKLIIKSTEEGTEELLHILKALRGLEVISLSDRRTLLDLSENGQDLCFDIPEDKVIFFKSFLKEGHVYFENQ